MRRRPRASAVARAKRVRRVLTAAPQSRPLVHLTGCTQPPGHHVAVVSPRVAGGLASPRSWSSAGRFPMVQDHRCQPTNQGWPGFFQPGQPPRGAGQAVQVRHPRHRPALQAPWGLPLWSSAVSPGPHQRQVNKKTLEFKPVRNPRNVVRGGTH